MLSLILGVLLMSLTCTRSTQKADMTAAEYETTSSGDIAFRLTPRRSDGRLILDIQADTHSGDLSELNLKDLVVLRADGRSYRPVESASLTGHHAQGMVTFDVPGSIERFSITIAGVRGMSELTFDWP
jgi:hypothetical protein